MSSNQLFFIIYYKNLKNILLAQIDLLRRTHIEARQTFLTLYLRILYTIVVHYIMHYNDNAFDILKSNRKNN